MRKALVVWLFAALCLTSLPVGAQVSDEAFLHFEEGAKAYQAEDYRGAIEAFREGYEVQAHPMFQVNIALAHWRLGELLDAIAAADLAAVGAEDLGPKTSSENAARRATFSVMRTSRERANSIAADIAAAQEEPTVVMAPPPPEPKSSSLSVVGWSGIATAGVGGALLVGWMIAEVGLSDDLQRYERAGETGDRAAYNELGEAFRRKQSTARVLLGSGIGLAAIGGGLIVFDLVRPRETGVSLRLSDGPGLVLTHRF